MPKPFYFWNQCRKKSYPTENDSEFQWRHIQSILKRQRYELSSKFQSRSMSDPTFSDIDFKSKMAWVWTTLKYFYNIHPFVESPVWAFHLHGQYFRGINWRSCRGINIKISLWLWGPSNSERQSWKSSATFRISFVPCFNEKPTAIASTEYCISRIWLINYESWIMTHFEL